MRVVQAALIGNLVSGHSHNGHHQEPSWSLHGPSFVGRHDWTVSTVAGSGPHTLSKKKPCVKDPTSWRDGAAAKARFAAPTRVQVVGGIPYVLDCMNGCVRSIQDGVVSSETPCCTSDMSTGTNGQGPQDFFISDDNFLYMLDSYNNQLKQSPWPFQGEWTVLAGNGSRPFHGLSADGPALEQTLNNPHGMAVTTDGSGDVYLSQTFSSCVSLLRNGVLTTVAGKCGNGGYADGDPAEARFQHPHSITLDPRNESVLYLNDAECWDDEPFPDDQVYKPCAKTSGGVCFSGIRKIELDRSTGLAVRVSTLAGKHSSKRNGKVSKSCNDFADGDQSTAMFDFIHGTAFLPLSEDEKARKQAGESLGGSDAIYVADEDGNRIRKVDLHTKITSTVAGNGNDGLTDGAGSKATFNYPGGLGLDLAGNIYVGDYESHRIRLITAPQSSVHV